MNEQWYYQIMGDECGPVDAQGLRQLVSSNDIQRETFVRSEDGEWVAAERVSGLFQPVIPRQPKREPQWYFRVMGEVRGPIAAATLQRLAAQNDITRDTFVRRNNEDWVTADRVRGLLS